MPRVITLDELRARLDSGDPVTLVEALPPMYYEQEHLPGADQHPPRRGRLAGARAAAGGGRRDRRLLRERPCQNSGSASRRLASLGYANVSDYHEGKAEWIAAPPVESGRPGVAAGQGAR